MPHVADLGGRPEEFLRARRLFLALLGASYFAAFASYATQVDGLIGSAGILPAAEYLAQIRAHLSPGEAWAAYPTLFWLDSSDAVLRGTAGAGAGLALALTCGLAPRLLLVLLWAGYLSLTVAGGVFLGYQWDNLLLEAGLCALFVAPRGLWPGERWRAPPSALGLLVPRLLLAKLMFLSGVTKLASGDPTWRDLSALDFHFWTQPLPSWIGWFAAQAPPGALRGSVAAMLVIEIVMPVLAFGARPLRLFAAGAMVALQLAIGVTGNFGFFNLLTIALCVLFVDDRALHALLPVRALAPLAPLARAVPRWRRALPQALAAALLLLSATTLVQELAPGVPLPAPLRAAVEQAGRLRSVSGYGLFRTMTTQRTELIVEGSDDGKRWRAFELRDKPGDPERAPPVVGFHMPRLDWQMWFEALRWPYRNRGGVSAWFLRFQQRLLEGSPAVKALLAHDPFPDRPPRFLRVRGFAYAFADRAVHERTGAWWQRRKLGEYTPAVTLDEDRLVRAW
jgi:hypothetical protein